MVFRIINKFLVVVLSISTINQMAFSQTNQIFESEFTVSSTVLVSDLRKPRITVCENKPYYNNEDKICLSVGSDFAKDGSLFLSDIRLHLEDLKYQYNINIIDFSLSIDGIEPVLNAMTHEYTQLNSYLHIGKLKTEGYIQYFINPEVKKIKFSIKLKLRAWTVEPESLGSYIAKIDNEKKYTRIQSVITTDDVNCFLTVYGKVKCVGVNESGILGLGRPAFEIKLIKNLSDSSFIDFGTDSPVIQVVALDRAFCALFEIGQVKCWGSNGLGRLGIEAPDFNLYSLGDEPKEIAQTDFIKFSEPIKKMFSNRKTICGLTVGSNLKCWGSNAAGILGQETHVSWYRSQADIENAAYINLGDQVKDMFFAGDSIICAILFEDSIKCWGENRYGALGQETSLQSMGGLGTPMHSFDSIAVPKKKMKQWGTISSYSPCVLYEDGDLYCWGYNKGGLLGQESKRDSIGKNIGDIKNLKPIAFESKIIKFVSTGYNVCVLLENGQVKCWGRDWSDIRSKESIGDEPGEIKSLASMAFGTTSKAIDITSDNRVICADFADTTRRCWGENTYYQLAQGIDMDSYGFIDGESAYLKPIFPNEYIEKYFVGSRVNCILTTAGQLKCLGDNSFGQLGLPASTYRFGKDANELDRSTYLPLGDIRVKNLLLLDLQLCAIFVTDQMKCWGFNRNGTLGQGSEMRAVGRSSYELESLDYLKY